ncbi:MBL fold metallo-hydrolase [Pseudoalteromonas shioyasakiensis]|uniref:ComEC/Rec2 family competence protein n=1 Tax=Pseudoalteromonas shioyasakiensis TaxID=1190813 RepID=UPI001EFCCB33|nr:MBL fold metallo-hydrolase [Pseudoalteromonas shioyasakiensis]MCG9736439.1 MBL fold metallo-hydrolase [Pseudoalteromonas shioyasakiensis]
MGKSFFLLNLFLLSTFTFSNDKELLPLEIHYINVGQGGSTLIVGPNGTKILYDFGNKNGRDSLVPYLDSLGWGSKKLHYSILSHKDQDHFNGYKGLIDGGYDFKIKNYVSGSSNKKGMKLNNNWFLVTKLTTAGEATQLIPGIDISLGGGASAFVAYASGRFFDGTEVKVSNENDFSAVLLITYKNFQFILDGDLGSGSEKCSNHNTKQSQIQKRVADLLIKNRKLTAEHGVDVMHIAHHGSQSSTSAGYVNQIKPEIGIVSVGQNCTYRHPDKVVMDMLLKPFSTLSTGACVDLTALKEVYQTDKGSTNCSNNRADASNTGFIGGDIVIKTDGIASYSVNTSGALWIADKKVFEDKPTSTMYQLDEISINY